MENKTKFEIKRKLEKEKKYMEFCSKCFKEHGNQCIAKDCFLGRFTTEIRDFYLETELWNKIFHNKNNCTHENFYYHGFSIENNKIIPKHAMLSDYLIKQCVNCGKILGIVKPKKPKRKFKVH